MLRFRRSAGVAVGPLTHHRITRANRARDRGDWAAAREGYARAVAGDPALAHVWLQLGHAEKELGRLADARAAYGRAAALQPNEADPPLHLAHVAKLDGDPATAFDLYRIAMRRRPAAETLGELHRLVMAAEQPARADMAAALRDTLAIPAAPADGRAEEAVFLDISDLIAFFSHQRLPTGIQRVQIEVLAAVLDGAAQAGVCVFVGGQDGWAALPHAALAPLVRLAVQAGGRDDQAWLDALGGVYLALADAPPLRFPPGARLVNLGSSWGLPNYFLHLRAAKARAPLAYVPLVYDVIPLLRPEWFPERLVQQFVAWAVDVFAHADLFLAGSQATRADLLTAADRLGRPLAPAQAVAVRLDGDFRKAPPADPATLARWGLTPGRFVLFVATLEPRKGHLDALEAWSRLLARLGPERVPRLVLVGGRGWLNDAIHRRLAGDRALAGHVLRLSGMSDGELALLYKTSRFTLYPSLYEGWGLPVSEALSWGKVPLTTRVASLPEAGGDFAVYVPAGNPAALAEAAERLIVDEGWLAEREAAIAARHRSRPWSAIAASVIAAAGQAQPAAATLPFLTPETHYWLAQSPALSPEDAPPSGECFRSGLGWAAPDRGGCRVLAGGGALAFRSDGGWLAVDLVGLPEGRAGYRIGEQAGRLAPAERRTVRLAIERGETRLLLAGDRLAAVPREDGPPDPAVSIGVVSLCLHPTEDC